jgi:hypothetical protein
VTEADLGKVQTFEISTREHYGVIDAFLFSTNNQLLTEYTQEQMDEFFLNRGGPIGDFDGSGTLDVADINDLTAQSAGQMNPAGCDLNGDSAVNAADVKVWVKDLLGAGWGTRTWTRSSIPRTWSRCWPPERLKPTCQPSGRRATLTAMAARIRAT